MDSKEEGNSASDNIDDATEGTEAISVKEVQKPNAVTLVSVGGGSTDSEEELQVQNRVDSIALAKKRLQSKGASNETPKSRFGQTDGSRRRSFSDTITNFGRKLVKNLSSTKQSTND